jgi:hypothetical protein
MNLNKQPEKLDTKENHTVLMHIQGFSMMGMCGWWFLTQQEPWWAGFVFLLLAFGSWKESRLWFLGYVEGAVELLAKGVAIFKGKKD